jgi:hypothetical protein
VTAYGFGELLGVLLLGIIIFAAVRDAAKKSARRRQPIEHDTGTDPDRLP